MNHEHHYLRHRWAIDPFEAMFGTERVALSEDTNDGNRLSFAVYGTTQPERDPFIVNLRLGPGVDVNYFSKEVREAWLEELIDTARQHFSMAPLIRPERGRRRSALCEYPAHGHRVKMNEQYFEHYRDYVAFIDQRVGKTAARLHVTRTRTGLETVRLDGDPEARSKVWALEAELRNQWKGPGSYPTTPADERILVSREEFVLIASGELHSAKWCDEFDVTLSASGFGVHGPHLSPTHPALREANRIIRRLRERFTFPGDVPIDEDFPGTEEQ